MGMEADSLVGKKVFIKWRFLKGKPELNRYKCFSVLAITGDWIQAQPFYELNQKINDEPPVWLPLSDIKWMAEIART